MFSVFEDHSEKFPLFNLIYLFKKMDLQKDQKEQPVFALDCGAL